MSGLLQGRAYYTDLPALMKLTLLALCDEANDSGERVFIGQVRLAHKVGCGERALRTNLGKLRDLGYIERTSRGSSFGRQGRPDHHRILIDRLPTTEEIRAWTGTPADHAGDGNTGNLTSEHRQSDVRTPARAGAAYPLVKAPARKAPASLSSDRQFEEFFTIFPTARKGSRRVVRKAWDKAIKRHPAVRIIAKARDYRDDPNRQDEFTKGAAVWLNNDCWEDGPLPSLNGKSRRAAELPLDRIARELVEEMNGQHPGKNARDDTARQLSG